MSVSPYYSERPVRYESPEWVRPLDISQPGLSKYLGPGDNGTCVPYARALTGRYDIKGNAIDWRVEIDSQVPTLGSIAVFAIGELGHLGTTIEVEDERFKITERTDWIISERWVGNDNMKRLLGFIEYKN